MKNYLLLLAVAATVGFTSCSNDDDEVPPKTKTELLTASSWKQTSFTVNPPYDDNNDGTPDSDLFQFIDACTQDDITTFKSDNSYTEDEGATKCAQSDPQVFTTGTWAFTNNESVLSITRNGSSQPDNYTITELTENSLKYTETVTNPTDNVAYTFTYTFTH